MSIVPTFARIEIRMTDKNGLKETAGQLAKLAKELASISEGGLTDEIALLAGYQEIKGVSQELRKGD